MPNWWDEDDDVQTDDGATEGAPAQEPDKKALLRSLVDADPDGPLGKMAVDVLDAMEKREAEASKIAAALVAAESVKPRTLEDAIASFEALQIAANSGEPYDEDKLRQAALLVDEMKDALRERVRADERVFVDQLIEEHRKVLTTPDRLGGFLPADEVAQRLSEYRAEVERGQQAAFSGDALDRSPVWQQYQWDRSVRQAQWETAHEEQINRPGWLDKIAKDAEAAHDAAIDAVVEAGY